MKDYELGKLAEELIQSRYSEKLKAKDEKIAELEIKLKELEERKTYCEKTIISYTSTFGYRTPKTTVEYQYKSLDEITDELTNKTKHIESLNKDINTLSIEKTSHDSFIHRNKLSSFLYKKWKESINMGGLSL